MKVALLSYEYPPETGFGGIGSYTWYQARALVRAGHDVHVLAGAPAPTDLRESEHDGVRVFRFRADLARHPAVRGLGVLRLPWSKNRLDHGISTGRGFTRLLERNAYDVVEMPECGADGLRVAGRIGVPTVARLHSPARLIMPMYGAGGLDTRLCAALEQTALRRVTAIASCSRFLAQEGRAKLGLTGPIEVIHNGIDLTLFDADDTFDARRRFDVPGDAAMVFFAGRLERRKGIHVMRDVVGRVLARRRAVFVFAGEDASGWVEREMRPRLTEQSLDAGCRFLGRLDHASVRACLRAADVFVIPSLWESCPYSCLEAMAAGRAIVAAAAGGLPELVEHDADGLVAPVEDVARTAGCIERLLDDEALRARLGVAARRRVEDAFTDAHMASRTAELYRAVIVGAGA